VNIAADLAGRTERHGWAAAPAFVDERRTWTHGEVHDLSARAATVLGGHGVRVADRVLIALPDRIGWVIAFLAVARLGATAVPPAQLRSPLPRHPDPAGGLDATTDVPGHRTSWHSATAPASVCALAHG
jgi:acyl-coenzyme A synthetase/AMP-(fatty) acid ligase